jgi:hypothetical protein
MTQEIRMLLSSPALQRRQRFIELWWPMLLPARGTGYSCEVSWKEWLTCVEDDCRRLVPKACLMDLNFITDCTVCPDHVRLYTRSQYFGGAGAPCSDNIWQITIFPRRALCKTTCWGPSIGRSSTTRTMGWVRPRLPASIVGYRIVSYCTVSSIVS